jgi:tyrosine-specific transport protein
MHFDAVKIRKAILIGSFLPFITYSIWQWLILGIIPLEGPHGLANALEQGENAVIPLKYFLESPSIYLIGQIFAFLALLTSFFGVTLGLVDFLADGLKVKKTPRGRLILSLLVFIPPLLIALRYPHAFLTALDYAGGFGCALLLGLLPILMVWSKRYKMKDHSHAQITWGRPFFLLLIAFIVFEIGIELFF